MGKTKSPIQECLVGSFGGFCGTVVGQPLDTIKVRLQTGATEQLLRNLFAGVSAPLCSVPVVWGVNFFTYTHFLNSLNSATGKTHSITNIATAGFLSGVLFGLSVTPFDVVKCNAQKLHMSSIEAFSHTSSIWRGACVTMLRDGPGIGAWFTAYEVVLNAGMSGFLAGGPNLQVGPGGSRIGLPVLQIGS